MSPYLYGRNAVLEALRAGRGVQRLWVASTAHGGGLFELVEEARRRDVPVSMVDRRVLDQRSPDQRHQGVLAEVAPFSYRRLDDLLERAEERGEPPLLLALDSLQDPQNFGTLLRTALATGVHGVLIPEHRAVGMTPAVSKASAGAVEHLPIARVGNLVRTLESLKERGVWIHGLVVGEGKRFWDVDWTGPVALVVGAEGPGLHRLVRETCDVLVELPMAPEAVQSLNAATAGSVVLYEAFRQRTTRTARDATT